MMKRIRLFIKGLLFLSFFLPFFVLPTCSNKVAREKFLQDSLYRDSIIKDSLNKVGMLNHYLDSIKNHKNVTSDLNTSDTVSYENKNSVKTTVTHTDTATSAPVETKSFSDYLSGLLTFLMYPTEETINGFGVTVVALIAPFQGNSFELSGLFLLIFSLSFFFSLSTLIIQSFKPCRKIHVYLSIISLLILIYLGLFFKLENTLWGYYVALTFNLSDILVMYLSLRRKTK